MSGLSERQPLGSVSTSAPRQARRPPQAPTLTPRPRPSGWVRFLEQPDNTLSRQMRRYFPGIAPARGGRKENDPYNHLETLTIRCGKHVAIVHSVVVLEQSRWLRREEARRNDPEAPIHVPRHIRWWQVAWALEYMYGGSVPSFGMLASEEISAGYPERRSRSIAWGLLELWDVAVFFGLQGLARRAAQAFMDYFGEGIRNSILLHRGAIAPRPAESASEASTRVSRQNRRFIEEFWLAAWKIFDEVPLHESEYINMLESDGRWHLSDQATPGDFRFAWEGTLFDTSGEPDDEGFVGGNLQFLGPTPPSSAAFRPAMVNLCMHFADLGLFELNWFRAVVPEIGPMGLRVALAQRMADPESRWPRDEFPGAPYSFEMVNPWRLIASNARAVPRRNAEDDGALS